MEGSEWALEFVVATEPNRIIGIILIVLSCSLFNRPWVSNSINIRYIGFYLNYLLWC